MQISQNNNPSFGIKSVRFTSPRVKSNFEEMTKKVSPKKLANMWDEIRTIKPKKGPDIDVFIDNSLMSYGVPGYQYTPVKLGAKKGKTTVSEFVLEGKPEKIIDAFKTLVSKVEKIGKAGKKADPDLMVF